MYPLLTLSVYSPSLVLRVQVQKLPGMFAFSQFFITPARRTYACISRAAHPLFSLRFLSKTTYLRYQCPCSRGETRLRCVANRKSSFPSFSGGRCIINPLTSTLFTAASPPPLPHANWVERIRPRQFSHPRLAERNYNGVSASRRARLPFCTFDFFARRSATSTSDVACNSKRPRSPTYDFHFVMSRRAEVCRDIFSPSPRAAFCN